MTLVPRGLCFYITHVKIYLSRVWTLTAAPWFRATSPSCSLSGKLLCVNHDQYHTRRWYEHVGYSSSKASSLVMFRVQTYYFENDESTIWQQLYRRNNIKYHWNSRTIVFDGIIHWEDAKFIWWDKWFGSPPPPPCQWMGHGPIQKVFSKMISVILGSFWPRCLIKYLKRGCNMRIDSWDWLMIGWTGVSVELC